MKIVLSEKVDEIGEEYQKVFNIKKREDGKWEISVDELSLLKYLSLDKSVVIEKISGFIRWYREQIEEISYSKEEVYNIVDKAIQLDKEWRKIYLDDNCDMIIKHPFIQYNVELKCWNAKSGKLVNPILYKEDIETLKFNEFEVIITEAQLIKIQQLIDKIKSEISTAYVYPSAEGYILGLDYRLFDVYADLKRTLVNKLTVKYHRSDGDEILTFIEQLTTVPEEIRNDEETKDKILKYYECKLFTYPSIKLLLEKLGVKVIERGKIFRDYPTLDYINADVYSKLYNFQKESVDNWMKMKLGTIVEPTAGGKTVEASAIISLLKVPTLYVVNRIELLEQTREEIAKWLGIDKWKIGLYYGAEKDIKDITVATYQTTGRRMSDEEEENDEEENGNGKYQEITEELKQLMERFALVIFDEGHHSPAPVFKNIMLNVKSPYRLIISATPEREDRNEALAYLACGEVVAKHNYWNLLEERKVCPIKYHKVYVDLTDEEEELIEMKAQLDNLKMEGYKWGRRDEVKEKVKEWEMYVLTHPPFFFKLQERYKIEKMRKTPRTMGSITNILHFAQNKWITLLDILRKHKDDKIIIFNQRVAGAECLFYFCLEWAKNECPEMLDNIYLIYGATARCERRYDFEQFKKARRGIMITTNVLEEGINVPDINVVVMFNRTKVKRQMIQTVGRGCRPRKGKVEYVYELIARPKEKDEDEEAIVEMIADIFERGYSPINIPEFMIRSKRGMRYVGRETVYKYMEMGKSKARDITQDVIKVDEMEKYIQDNWERIMKEREEMKNGENNGN
jgi:superfamily II DNA or RNA helicase